MLLKASFIGTFAENMLLPLWSSFTAHVGGSILDAGLGFAFFSIATGCAVMIGGSTKFFAKHIKWILFWGFLVAGLGDLLYLFVTNKYELFAVQSLIGLSLGFANPAWDTIYSDDEESDQSAAQKWSFWTGGISFVVGISALFGSIVVSILGFHAMFILMFFFDLISISYCYRLATIKENR